MRMKSLVRIGAIVFAGLTLSACVADGGYYTYSETYAVPEAYPAPYYSRPAYRPYYYERPYHRRHHHRRDYYGYY